MRKLHKFLIIVGAIALVFYILSIKSLPERITYGVSFSKFHADELELDWKKTYFALLDDLRVRHFRFTAHWPNTEPEDGKFNFKELDYQIAEANKRGADYIIAIGRRLPGWPECHDPQWIKDKAGDYMMLDDFVKFRQDELLEYMEKVVERYKKEAGLKYWQVENEPYLGFFSRSLCGELDKEFLAKEMELVRGLDPGHQILLTSSGEFDPWFPTYKRADVFGSSLYLYVWWRTGPTRYPITPAFFRIKQNLIELIYGKKPKMLIELSAEPWLLQPIINAPLEVLLDRMGIDKFNEMIQFASKTGFDTQYLWGAEWWYWLKVKHGITDHWERARELFKN